MKAWEKNVRKVEPYVPGEQPKIDGIIKLNTNENPYPPSEKVMEALKALENDKMRLYPDPEAVELRDEIAKKYGTKRENVFVGVGSDDVISMCYMTFFNSDKPILFPNISYSFYPVWADVHKVPYKEVEVGPNFEIIVDTFKQKNGGIIFPNPNAPTGLSLGLDAIEQIVASNQDSVVIVDEAYVDFGTESALKLVDKYDNLLVVQTYSKSRSLAGMRIGFAIGNVALINALNDVKFSFNSYTMNYTSIKLGVAVMDDWDYFEETRKKIIATRERSKEELTKLGFTFPDSKANFIFASHKTVKAEYIFDELKKRKIYVRYFKKPLIDSYLRITIGTDEAMDKLFEALREIVA